jgi:Flp pilus assembly protein TadB
MRPAQLDRGCPLLSNFVLCGCCALWLLLLLLLLLLPPPPLLLLLLLLLLPLLLVRRDQDAQTGCQHLHHARPYPRQWCERHPL